MINVYQEIRLKAYELCKSQNFLGQPVRIRARTLSTEEAIGNPEADDFPLQKGKEKLMQAEFFDSLGLCKCLLHSAEVKSSAD